MIRRFGLIALIVWALPVAAVGTPGADVVETVDNIVARIQSDYVEAISQDLVWDKLVAAMKTDTQDNSAYQKCLPKNPLNERDRPKRLNAIAQLLECSAASVGKDIPVAAVRHFVASIDVAHSSLGNRPKAWSWSRPSFQSPGNIISGLQPHR